MSNTMAGTKSEAAPAPAAAAMASAMAAASLPATAASLRKAITSGAIVRAAMIPGGRMRTSPHPEPRVQHVAQSVAEQVEAEPGHRQRHAGEQAHPEGLADHALAARDHVAPRGHVGRHADAEKSQDGLG